MNIYWGGTLALNTNTVWNIGQLEIYYYHNLVCPNFAIILYTRRTLSPISIIIIIAGDNLHIIYQI